MNPYVRLFFILSLFFVFSSSIGCSDPVAITDCRAIVAVASCPIGTAARVDEDLTIEGTCEEGLFVDADGNSQGTCNTSESSDCSFVCKQVIGCLCGLARITTDSVECRDCETACGDGICDLGETAIEGEEGYCPNDCDNTCVVSEKRCNGDIRESCNDLGIWEELPCPTEEPLCQGNGLCFNGTTCSDEVQNGDESGIDCGGSCPVCSDMTRISSEDGGPVTFEMGSPDDEGCGRADERPLHTVTLSPFDIDTYEVSAAEYDSCIDANICAPAQIGNGIGDAQTSRDPQKRNHPINGVSWNDATNYCSWVGKRLPTEAEWELAAKGETNRLFPWGNDCPSGWHGSCCNGVGWDQGNGSAKANCIYFNCGNDGFDYSTAPVDSYLEGASPYGVYNMAGNVEEWTADFYGADYYSESPSVDPKGPTGGTHRVSRGSYFYGDGIWMRSSSRNRQDPTVVGDSNGFRCANSL